MTHAYAAAGAAHDTAVHDAAVHDTAVHDTMLRLVARLTGIVDGECAAIRGNPAADLSGFVDAKNRALYELELAIRNERSVLADPHARVALKRLRDALATNETLLQAHIMAVGDAIGVVEQISGAVPSDGTYGNPAYGKPAAYL